MADIALLVAEEHERRIKIMNGCSVKPREEQRWVGGFNFIDMGVVSNYVKGKIEEEKVKRRMEVAGKWVLELEPKSPIGVAASHGFFSA